MPKPAPLPELDEQLLDELAWIFAKAALVELMSQEATKIEPQEGQGPM
jgi:hypothetical protein